jgi:hypothetical protein
MILSENRLPLFRIMRDGTNKLAWIEANDYGRALESGASPECSRSNTVGGRKRS